MSEEIVSCSGCGKKFRIPDGAPPGAFDCTACGVSVAYGGAVAAATGGKPASRSSSGRRSRSSRRSSAKGGAAKGRRSGGKRSRRGEPEPEESGRRGRRGARPEKENKTLPLIVGLMGLVLLAGILIIAFAGGDKKKDDGGGEVVAPEDNGGGGISSGGVTSGDSGGTAGGGGTGATGTTGGETSGGGTETTDPAVGTGSDPAGGGISSGGGVDSDPGDDSGIGDATGGGDGMKDYRHYFLLPLDELFQKAEPLEGTTPAEAAEFEKQVALFVDIDSGAAGMRAGRALEEAGAKAMPFLINAFCDQWAGSKWETENEQWASWQVQQTCRRLIQATRMPSEFEARFNPGTENDPALFKRAARMWVAWWKGTGQHLKEFTPHPEEEE